MVNAHLHRMKADKILTKSPLKKDMLQYRIFSNTMRTLFTVLEGQKVGYVLDSRSRAGFWKNDTAAVQAVRTIQYNNLLL
jgi:hypothetical protein